jgi:hypothetical protein
MAEIQNADAHRLLTILSSEAVAATPLTYQGAAAALGRDPKTNARTVAQMCDLLDAAAALARVPLLALVRVRNVKGEINPKAFRQEPSLRTALIEQSQKHKFTADDFAKIEAALSTLDGFGNIAAWRSVRQEISKEQLLGIFASYVENSDAINDLGTDAPSQRYTSGNVYLRDQQVREAVLQRAGGKCEFCGQLGFIRSNGTRYLESHHIIALADDGADRMTNVIALCAEHHREAHFGKRSAELEQAMTEKVRSLTVAPARFP